MEKMAANAHPIHDLIRERWSPRSFTGISVSESDLRSLLEAARWAPSAFNEQPWAYAVARRDEKESFQDLLDCLVPFNQTWASRAGALLIAIAHERFARNDKDNAHAWHDVGLANANLALQATARGLYLHFMAGFDADKTRSLLKLPDDWSPVCAIAIGHLGSPDDLSPELKERELQPRTRKPLEEFVFRGSWQSPPEWIETPS